MLLQLQAVLVPRALAAGLDPSAVPAVLAAVASANATALAQVPALRADPHLLAVVNKGASDSWAGAYAYVYYCALALGLCALGAACWTRDMDRYLTGHISRQIYERGEGGVDLLEREDVAAQLDGGRREA
ncbi:hypothetical protein SLS55_005917 [Diplodia seriata]|uniref:Uncharacterized protein n=1 Tax=Diplodia seriata TaxID=420778 RepID=A0ABR3CHS0_9PEZI